MKKRSSNKIIIYTAVILLSAIGCVYALIKHYTPLVSVVMPVYNREDLVARAIESVLSQTFTDFEFIIVDDGSTDNTPKILNDYASVDKRIKIIRNETNRGIPFSRNRGIQAARGTYIAQMDSDDYSVSERLAKSVRFMKEHPEVDALTGGIKDLTPETKNFNDLPENAPGDQYTIFKKPGFYEVDLLFYNHFYNIPSMYKSSFVKKHNIHYKLNYKAAEDYDFWFQFVKNGGKFASLKDALAFIRFHNSNNTNYYDAMVSNSMEIHKKALSLFFKPQEEDIKFSYTVFEKCDLLKKMMAGNKEKQVIPQKYLQKYYNHICPAGKDFYMLVHPNWDAYLEKEKNDRYRQLETQNYAKVTEVETENGSHTITVFWEIYPAEKFIKRPGNDAKYYYLPDDQKLQVNHTFWTDHILLNIANKIACREAVYDCGEYVLSDDENQLIIKWKNYPAEEFIKDSNNIYHLQPKKD